MFQKTLEAGIRRASELGLVVYCNSNLQPLKPETARFFKQHKVGILTSLLSHEPETHDRIVQSRGAHERLLKKIRLLTDMGVLTSANMVVRKDNACHVYDTGKLAHSLGVLRFSATKVAPSPSTEYRNYRAAPNQIRASMNTLLQLQDETGLWVEILETYPLCFIQDLEKYNQFLRRNCTAGVFNCSISPDGTVRPCAHADMTYGNLFDQSLQECWLAMQDWRNGDYLHPICRECQWLMQCSGGCRMDAKIYYGDIRERDPLMSKPENVRPAPKKSNVVDLPVEMQFRREVGTRAEEFGGVVKFNDELVFLNDRGYKTIQQLLAANRKFDWQEVEVEGITPAEKKQFFEVLFTKQMFY